MHSTNRSELWKDLSDKTEKPKDVSESAKRNFCTYFSELIMKKVDKFNFYELTRRIYIFN